MMLALLLAFALFQADPQPQKPGNVTGSVVDASTKAPVSNALVVLSLSGSRDSDNQTGTYTDETGRFTLHDLTPGTYELRIQREGFVDDEAHPFAPVVVTNGSDTDAGQLKVRRTGAISGRVLKPSGEPLPRAEILVEHLRRGSPQMGARASTDDRGMYRLFGLTPGKYKLAVVANVTDELQPVKLQGRAPKEAYAKTYYPGVLDASQAAVIEVTPGADLQGVDVGILSGHAFRIRGHVAGPDGTAPTFAFVMLQSDGTAYSARAGKDGAFEFPSVVPGTYQVIAVSPSLSGKQLTTSQQVQLADADVEGVQLALAEPIALSGKITVTGGGQLAAGTAILIRDASESGSRMMMHGGMAPVKADGSFVADNIVPGDYDVLLGRLQGSTDLYPASMRSGDQDLLTGVLHVGGAPPPPLEIVLQPGGAEIDCTVTNEDSKAAAHASVVLVPDPPHDKSMALAGNCSTDIGGTCKLTGVAPGSYHAYAFAANAEFNQRHRQPSAKQEGEALVVNAGDHSQLKLEITETDTE